MKELYYKNIVGDNPKKREVSIEEIFSRTKSKIAKKWLSKYFIKEKFQSDNITELKNWVFINKRKQCRKDCHIIKEYNSKTGLNKIICKVLGDFYVICGMTAYKIVYVNELKIMIVSTEK